VITILDSTTSLARQTAMADSPEQSSSAAGEQTDSDIPQERIEREDDRLRIHPVRGEPFWVSLTENPQHSSFQLRPDQLDRIFAALDGPAKAALEDAAGYAVAAPPITVHVEHLLLGLLNEIPDGPARVLLGSAGLTLGDVGHTAGHRHERRPSALQRHASAAEADAVAFRACATRARRRGEGGGSRLGGQRQ
jgi:hypothetical protein